MLHQTCQGIVPHMIGTQDGNFRKSFETQSEQQYVTVYSSGSLEFSLSLCSLLPTSGFHSNPDGGVHGPFSWHPHQSPLYDRFRIISKPLSNVNPSVPHSVSAQQTHSSHSKSPTGSKMYEQHGTMGLEQAEICRHPEVW